LSQFSRRARWLNSLFPASVLPKISDPGVVSDDVNLVQPYDGGGYGFADSSELVTRVTGVVGASGGFVILTTSAEEIFRLISADHVTVAGGLPDVWMIVIDNEGGGDSVHITQKIQAQPIGASQILPLQGGPVVIGPNMTITTQWTGGDAATQISFGIYGFRAPLGTVFHV
jgi:hypothetical protein